MNIDDIPTRSITGSYDHGNFQVGQTYVGLFDVRTSWLTVVNGVDLFETMVFAANDDSPTEKYTQRYATEDEAKAGHEAVVGMVRALVEIEEG